MKTALIAGATGLVGSHLLNLLLLSNQYQKVISVGRRKIPIEHPKLVQYIVDFEKLDGLLEKADEIFCCLGTTIKKAGSQQAFRKVDFEYPRLLADFGLKIGATSYHLISSMGAHANSRIFYNKVKGEIELEIISKQFVRCHIYRPSLLLGTRNEPRLVESIGKNLMNALSFLFIGTLKNYKAIEATKVAKCMISSSLLNNNAGLCRHSSAEMQNMKL